MFLPGMRSRLLTIVAVLGLLILVVLAAIHTSPVRNLTRERAERWLTEHGMPARIGSLSYNLARLSVDVGDISLAATARPDTPFFAARHVSVALEGFPF